MQNVCYKSLFEIDQLNIIPHPFQRDRAQDIVETIVEKQQQEINLYGEAIFPTNIVIANFQNLNYLLDGQHRLEAMKILTRSNPGINICILVVIMDCATFDRVNRIYEMCNYNNNYNEYVDRITGNLVPQKPQMPTANIPQKQVPIPLVLKISVPIGVTENRRVQISASPIQNLIPKIQAQMNHMPTLLKLLRDRFPNQCQTNGDNWSRDPKFNVSKLDCEIRKYDLYTRYQPDEIFRHILRFNERQKSVLHDDLTKYKDGWYIFGKQKFGAMIDELLRGI